MPTVCHTCKVVTAKPLRCSKCKVTIYCSAECQNKDWKVHRRSVCAKPAMLHRFDKMLEDMSKPGTPLSAVNEVADAVWAERARHPEPVNYKCDGCERRFHGHPSDDEDDEDEDEDAGEPFKRCTVCDYTVCEACTQPENQAAQYFWRAPGTCRCLSSNFGVSYCLSAPHYTEGDGFKRYYGDRHPKIAGSGYRESAFEDRPRRCKTCRVVARCLKEEHLQDVLPGMD